MNNMPKSKYLGIITKEVICTSEDASAVEVSRLMRDNDVGIIVIMRDDKVVGVVSERDITMRVVANSLSLETKVRDFMTKDVVTIEFREGLNKIYQMLCEIKFRHLLVMDNGKLVGITSRRDLLDALAAKKY